jgi:hypothetical protein
MRLFWIIAIIGGCLTVPASANAQTPYDGKWNVTTQTGRVAANQRRTMPSRSWAGRFRDWRMCRAP